MLIFLHARGTRCQDLQELEFYMENTGFYEKLKPFIVGGDTVTDTTQDNAEFENPPHKFEAGLQDFCRSAWKDIGFGILSSLT